MNSYKQHKKVSDLSHSSKSESPTSFRDDKKLIKYDINSKGLKTSSSVYPNDITVDKIGAGAKFKSLIMKHKLITSLVSLFGAAVVVTAIVPPTIYATGDLSFFLLILLSFLFIFLI
jgi:hypothetical protein